MDHFHYRDGQLYCEDTPVADLARVIGITPQGAALAIGHLRKIGWVTESQARGRGRSILLEITGKGREGYLKAAGIVGLDTLAQWKWTASSFSQLERKVVTFFILGSNFLDVRDPKVDLVSYVEAPLVCPNRFAEYD